MYKQIIIARKDLNMSSGKLSAQISHASMSFLIHMIKENIIGEVYDNQMNPKGIYRTESIDVDKGIYEHWINDKFTKCVLQARNKNHLLKAKKLAEELGLKEGKDFWLIYDSCRTELKPEFIDENGEGRTLTCIGFIPMEDKKIDMIGKKYHLYT